MSTNITKKQKEYVTEVDWVLYLERKQPLFLYASLINPYFRLKELVGNGFEHQLHIIDGNIGMFLRSESELDEVKQAFSNFVLDDVNFNTLKIWAEKGIELNRWADDVISQFENSSGAITAEEYSNLLSNYNELLLYSTVVPFWILRTAEYLIDTKKGGKEHIDKIINSFEHLRGDTRYPQMIEGVFTKIWKYLSDALSIDEALLRNTTPQELGEIIKTKDVSEYDLELRSKSIFWREEDKIIFSFDKNIIDSVMPNFNLDSGIIHGSISNKGFACGVAKVVNNIEDISKVNTGDIIVSINSSPAIMSALKKASAIVTDDGGITCHAAIVSRELNIPAVIGTKIATRVIKDGDLVEVDADKGVVRIINHE